MNVDHGSAGRGDARLLNMIQCVPAAVTGDRDEAGIAQQDG